MKTAQQIYEEYRIMPSLQLHQLRVAAVAKLICTNFKVSINERDVVLACLFHDMGNIIKSDLKYFTAFVEPEGLEYWERVKSEFVTKYGTDHHKANLVIAKEIGLPSTAVALIDSISFSQIADVVSDTSFERKIMQYADIRVGPHGVLPLRERLREGRERYNETRKSRNYYESNNEFDRLVHTAEELEQQVAPQTSIAPESITDAAVEHSLEELRDYSAS